MCLKPDLPVQRGLSEMKHSSQRYYKRLRLTRQNYCKFAFYMSCEVIENDSSQNLSENISIVK